MTLNALFLSISMRNTEAAEIVWGFVFLFCFCATFDSLLVEKSSGCVLQNNLSPSRQEIFVHVNDHI